MSKVIGTSVSRKDGRAKVTGSATYAAEHQIPGLVYGYLVTATIANGRIRSMDVGAAKRSPGVLAIFTHRNVPKIFNPANDWQASKISESRLPLSDDRIYYAGQIIGLVVADTLERARDAANLVQVEYEIQPPLIDTNKASYTNQKDYEFQKGQLTKDNFAAVVAGAAATVEATYNTEVELHSPLEPHAIIAHWHNADSVTIYEPTQWVVILQRTYADLLNIPVERVRVVTPYIGGSFGGKIFPWSHAILCTAVAREINRPLKVVVSRRQMTTNTGHRASTEQILRLAATSKGKLMAIEHIVRNATSPVENFVEPCTSIPPVMYDVPNLHLQQDLAVLNVPTPTYLRAPGENPGMWALESAMDELAWTLQIDPVQLRLLNETQAHQKTNLPFSAKHFADSLRVGSEKFGWSQRPKQPRAITRDGLQSGWGMAAASFPGYRRAGAAKVRLLSDGTAHVLTAGNDIGTGTYTIVAMTAAEALGLPVEKVRVELGDSIMPDGGLAGGSSMAGSLMPAVMQACQDLLKQAKAKTATEAIAMLRQSGRAAIEVTASTTPNDKDKKFTFYSWGAHFCEVSVDEEIGRLKVTRWLSVINVGRVLNAKTAASQIRGSVIMGIGQALMEECHFDPASGYPVVYDLATYHIPTHADIPRIEVVFVGEPDLNANSMGVRGVGEIGITGVAAAIANAIYHATGKRLRSLPFTLDKLITQ
ncbi:MAG: xanthine dehydrogenase family protein molybdopterin-binding subunit [Mojavia pulchra JT2-VF2]|jgi:xanthine dehydrogenase YagR molybdenum-binding subunit|uniref:Xanthine dehydrogenase family protein molybdopterin-binding subunit n=1 Tax=Mojavia pulchra JT2-VF2 TaxID=287848 RepID=A0A951Q6V4_9NOST|nr:xanthine dehydrogenase family protein molybdopterin-binding subunit [Mojavia pulchra JT2-VF2]